MNPTLRRLLGVPLAVGALAALAALSQAPYALTGASHAMLRLAWRVRSTPVRECRTRSPQELERLPVHMRRAEECVSRLLPYRLEVRIDDRVVVSELVHAAGARGDRPLYVHRELPLEHGEHVVDIIFEQQPRGQDAPDDQTRTPAHLRLRARLILGAGEVALVTYDPERQSLLLKGHGTPD
jgi:hypothetical protein